MPKKHHFCADGGDEAGEEEQPVPGHPHLAEAVREEEDDGEGTERGREAGGQGGHVRRGEEQTDLTDR